MLRIFKHPAFEIALLILYLIIAVIGLLITVNSKGDWTGGVITVMGTVLMIRQASINWDKIRTDQRLKQPQIPETVTIEDYLIGRLKAISAEDQKFVSLSGNVKIDSNFHTETQSFDDIDKILEEEQFKAGFVLVGDPGAGKSTALRHIEGLLIDEYLKYHEDNLLLRWPLWVNLGLTSNPVNVDELLEIWWNTRHIPGNAARHIGYNSFWLLLDGLNEMPLNTREERVEALRNFLKEQPTPIPTIITCRVDDYENDEVLHFDLPVVYIEELDDKRIQKFLNNYGIPELWSEFEGEENSELLEIAQNPYKLVMLITIFERHKRLPTNLNDLYRSYLEIAYNDYYINRKEPLNPLIRSSWKKLERNLEKLAFRMLTEGNGITLQVDRARQYVGNKTLIDGINMGVLKRDGDDIQFFHQSLHGYFVVEPLTRALKIDGRFDRFTKNPIALIRQIGDLGENAAPAVEPLITALTAEDRDIRYFAVFVLSKIKDSRAVEPLITALADEDRDIRIFATVALIQIGEKAVEPLINALSNTNQLVRARVAEALARINDSSIEICAKLISSNDKNVRHYVADILSKSNNPRAIDPLIIALSDKAMSIRHTAAEALGKIGDPRAVDPLIIALSDKAMSIRHTAAEALGRIGDPRAVDPLIKALADGKWQDIIPPSTSIPLSKYDDSIIYYNSIEAHLDELHNGRYRGSDELIDIVDPAVTYLINDLADDQYYIQFRGSDELIDIVDPAVTYLINDLADDQYYIQFRGSDEPIDIVGPAVDSLINDLADEQDNIRSSAADALGRIGDPRAIDSLIESLVNEQDNVRYSAAKALGRIGDPKAVNPLIIALYDVDWHVRYSAAKALGRIGDPKAVNPLIIALYDVDWHVRSSAAKALIDIGDPAVASLIKILFDEDQNIQIIAAVTLSKIDTPEARNVIKKKYDL